MIQTITANSRRPPRTIQPNNTKSRGNIKLLAVATTAVELPTASTTTLDTFCVPEALTINTGVDGSAVVGGATVGTIVDGSAVVGGATVGAIVDGSAVVGGATVGAIVDGSAVVGGAMVVAIRGVGDAIVGETVVQTVEPLLLKCPDGHETHADSPVAFEKVFIGQAMGADELNGQNEPTMQMVFCATFHPGQKYFAGHTGHNGF